ncbi:MAG: hypothetical protein JWO36_7208 [Myxococcales bacterium]|nr:hypothetical protein [Myxococcales bacterium]
MPINTPCTTSAAQIAVQIVAGVTRRPLRLGVRIVRASVKYKEREPVRQVDFCKVIVAGASFRAFCDSCAHWDRSTRQSSLNR